MTEPDPKKTCQCERITQRGSITTRETTRMSWVCLTIALLLIGIGVWLWPYQQFAEDTPNAPFAVLLMVAGLVVLTFPLTMWLFPVFPPRQK